MIRELHIRLECADRYLVRVDDEEHGALLSQAELCELIAFMQPQPSVSATPPLQVVRLVRGDRPTQPSPADDDASVWRR